jgi:signal transduction histidine kinase
VTVPTRTWAARHRQLVDVLFALAILAVSEAHAVLGHEPSTGSKPLLAVLAVPAAAPIAWRHRAPVAVWAVTGLASLGELADHGSSGPVLLAPLLALFTVAQTSERRTSLAVGLASLACAAAVQASSAPPGSNWAKFLFPVVVIAASWLVGDNLRVRRAYVAELEAKAYRAEAERAAELARAAAQERARIARELHDVVMHHVSVIAVQAGAARMVAEGNAGPASAPTLTSIEATARQALTELRQLLGVLRHEGEPPALAPQPGLAQLDQLISDMRQAGLPVTARVEGETVGLAPSADLSAYRIVQEALTNVIKHQGCAPTTVVLRYGHDDLDIEVTSSAGPPAPARSAPPGPGHGLIGMRERLTVLGGRLDAHALPGGGFVLAARVPLRASPA